MLIFNQPLLIQWPKLKPGASIFVPCIDRTAVQRFIRRECRRFGVDVVTKQVVENGVYGVRAWRKADTIPSHSSSPHEKA